MNKEQLNECIMLYGKDVFSFCRQIAVSHEEAEDLYQDTFLKAMELSEKIKYEENPKSYLMGIALNLYRNYKRKLSVRQRIAGVSVSLDETAELIPMEGPLTEEVMIVREECRIVREAVRKLPDKYRIPILLFYMEELSQAEIAAVLRISESAVKTRVHRAKKLLKEKLEGLL